MDLKLELGKKIRVLREKKNTTREEFCKDESNLTVRQLLRIENGESLPSLPKLTYISQELSTPIHHLIDEQFLIIPSDYLWLKGNIINRSLYGREDKIADFETVLDDIYVKYYDKLPEDEQLFIDLQQAHVDFQFYSETKFGEPIIMDYIDQLFKKKQYTINNLVLLETYLHFLSLKDYEPKLIHLLIRNAINKTDLTMEQDSFMLLRVLIATMGTFEENHDFKLFKSCLQVANTIIKERQDFKKKPIVDMLEGKYILFCEGNHEKAYKLYTQASLFAEMIDNNFLAKKILEEYEIDYKKCK